MSIKTKIKAALALAVFFVPAISFAQTVSTNSLQSQIAALLAQVAQLQTQLSSHGGSGTTWCYAFNANLSVGMSGSGVTALQTALQKDGESVTVNGTFDDQTASAVTGFQQKYASDILSPYGLANGTGYAGKATRAKLNSLFGCGTINPIGTPTPITPPIVVNPVTPTTTSPIACSMIVRYCPYGSYTVAGNNGCGETICNSAPTSTTSTPSLTVLSPNGGETLTIGTTYDIKYTSTYPQNEEPETGVALYQGNTMVGYPIYTDVSPDVFAWNVGKYTTNDSSVPQTAVPGSNYYIKVYMAGGVQGMSNGPFTITSASVIQPIPATSSTITVSGVSAGETVSDGQYLNFGFTASPVGNYDVEYILVPDGSTPIKTAGNGSFYDSTFGGYNLGGISPTAAFGTLNQGAAIANDIPAGTYHLMLFLLPSGAMGLGQATPQYAIAKGNSNSFSIISSSSGSAFTTPTITNINPASGATGSVITITGTNFASTNVVKFGGYTAAASAVSSNGTNLTFTVPTHESPTCTPGKPCSDLIMNVQPGVYQISVTNALGTSNTMPFTVTGGIGIISQGPQLAVTTNSAFPSGSVQTGVTAQDIGSYILSAPTSEAISLNNFSINAGQNAAMFQNLKIMVNGTQFGTTQGTVANNGTYTFAGTPFTLGAGVRATVNVYADVLSSATPGTANATMFTNCSATGETSYAIYTCNSVTGSTMTITKIVPPTLGVGIDSSSPSAGTIVMGSTGNTLGVFRFTTQTSDENIKITDLTVTDSAVAPGTIPPKPSLSNLTLWNGATEVGAAGSASNPGVTSGMFAYSFHFASPIIVPAGNSISLTLRGDAATYSSAGATDNSLHHFLITSTGVMALGASSNVTAAVTSSNAFTSIQTILRSTMTVSAVAMGGSSHAKSVADTLGTVTFAANNAGPVALNQLKITFSGNILSASGTAALMNSVTLVDQNGNNIANVGEATMATSTNTATWIFANGFQISAGSSYTFSLRANTTLAASVANIAQSFGASIQSANDVQYTDSLDSAGTAGLGLPSSLVPLTINSVTYPIGQVTAPVIAVPIISRPVSSINL